MKSMKGMAILGALVCSLSALAQTAGPSPLKLQTDLCAAISAGDAKALTAALDKGAHLDQDCPEQMTPPILHAVDTGNVAVVTLLLDRGANVNHEDNGVGATPMHYAAAKKNAEMVTLLAKRGGKVNVFTSDGLSPLALAVWEGADTAVVQALIDAGADVNAADEQGDTILDIANAKGHKQVAKLLVAKGAMPGDATPTPPSPPAPQAETPSSAQQAAPPSSKRTKDGKLIFKGLYLGMPLNEAITVFQKAGFPPQSERVSGESFPEMDAQGIGKYADGTLASWCLPVGMAPRWIVKAHPDGRVMQILIRGDAVNRLFELKDISDEEFMGGFLDAYGLRAGVQVVPLKTASPVRWKVEGPENVDALQFVDANGWYITLNNYKDIAYGELEAKPKAKFD